MIIGSSKLRHRFLVMKSLNEGEYGKEKAIYRVRLEKAMIFTLMLTILLFLISRRIPYKPSKTIELTLLSVVSMESIPQTTQGSLPRPPTLPQVPIPTEDEFIPEDETIEITRFDLYEDIPLFDGVGGGGGASAYSGVGRPRPIREVIPEYPNSERREGFEGVIVLEILVNAEGYVDSVKVLDNTTRSKRLEQSAMEAALKSQYVPAKRDGRNVPIWIQRPYRFERK